MGSKYCKRLLLLLCAFAAGFYFVFTSSGVLSRPSELDRASSSHAQQVRVQQGHGRTFPKKADKSVSSSLSKQMSDTNLELVRHGAASPHDRLPNGVHTTGSKHSQVKGNGPNRSSVNSSVKSRDTFIDKMSSTNQELIQKKSEDRKDHYDHTWISMPVVEANLLPQRVIESVKYFLFFVGHGRGGSSILGSLVDAHPNIVVATDYQLFTKWRENPDYHCNRSILYTALFVRSTRVANSYAKNEMRGYSLYIENAFMGGYKDYISVIGEKEAGSATGSYAVGSSRWRDTYQQIQNTTQVPVKMIQIIRNPFDNIATMTIFVQGGSDMRKELVKQGGHMDNSELLSYRIKAYFRNIHAVYGMQHDPAITIDLHQLHLSDLVSNPEKEMRGICTFLGVECFDWYIQTCKDHIFSKPSQTRDKVEWSKEQKELVQSEIDKIPWLERYSFESV